MIVGVTGSRYGNTTAQLHTLRSWLIEHLTEIESLHHGCCDGFDTMVSYQAHSLGIPMEYHPPKIKTHQMVFPNGGWDGVWWPEKEYRERNTDIVNICDVLIAGPKEDVEEVRSGTWSTLRYAKSIGKEYKVLRKMGGWLEW